MDTTSLARLFFEGAICVDGRTFREWLLKELLQMIPATGAMWRRGHTVSEITHSQTLVNLPPTTAAVLSRNRANIAVYAAIGAEPGVAVALEDLISDEQLRVESFNRRVLEPLGLGRILAIRVEDKLTGLCTEIALFRSLDDPPFGSEAKYLLARAAPLMIAAATQSYFLNAARPTARHWSRPTALVDSEGRVYHAQDSFLSMIQKHFPSWRGGPLPFDIPDDTMRSEITVGRLTVFVEVDKDLAYVRIWERGALEGLTDREREIADAIASGRSYKSVARDLDISPSTVSNHLQRIYTKLAVSSRDELASLVNTGAD